MDDDVTTAPLGPNPIHVRPATPGDRSALGHVAYATGFFGASAERFFPDPRLFGDLWVEPYLEGAGCGNLVAEAAGQVIGYVIGTCDLAAYRRYFALAAPRLAGRLLRGRYPRWRGCLPYLVRMARYPAHAAPRAAFPAQLHVNVLAGTRGQGVGGTLLASYLEGLARRGVAGVQLSTTRENVGAIRLYEKLGFATWDAYESPLWRPWLGRSVTHLVMTRAL